ncbi:DM13 domain-containing protein [Actinoplanes sp. NEAU-A12]|uniref:DM13 domain-containing protein n=1 Tax=Actinoplanes sandaracinus TaxID=3045177 RepID=A0ABT6X1E9_9ACTN|nr:DM13 domain-containing protein [Actinoplanes sandaracinus]MDI6105851.1 DM13 domain-containing protein [Actinoplanes sandaracinus]
MIRRLLTTPVTWAVVTLLGLAGAGALFWFQPWRLFTDTTVTDTISVVASAGPVVSGSPGQPGSSAGPAASGSPARPGAASPVVVAEGSFVTHEHDTTGSARVIRNADGSHQLELVGLDTSDGPDLRVLLSDQPVRPGVDGWRVFDDGVHTELGRLKGNHGDQVYPFRAGVDPAAFRSVSIWCERFSVSFGAASLA